MTSFKANVGWVGDRPCGVERLKVSRDTHARRGTIDGEGMLFPITKLYSSGGARAWSLPPSPILAFMTKRLPTTALSKVS